jgi:hypothetical protein
MNKPVSAENSSLYQAYAGKPVADEVQHGCELAEHNRLGSTVPVAHSHHLLSLGKVAILTSFYVAQKTVQNIILYCLLLHAYPVYMIKLWTYLIEFQ